MKYILYTAMNLTSVPRAHIKKKKRRVWRCVCTHTCDVSDVELGCGGETGRSLELTGHLA